MLPTNNSTHTVFGAHKIFYVSVEFLFECDNQDCARSCSLYCLNCSFHNGNFVI